MDLSTVDMSILAPQLRKPEGELGEEVGKTMAQNNAAAIAFTFQCLEVLPADRVLEIGFGPGEGIAEAVRLTPKGYVAGIDHSETMLQMAEQRNHRAVMQEHVELTLGEAAQMPYLEDGFDKIFGVNVFHFWREPSPELAECLRALKPGGRIVFFQAHPSSWRKGMAESGVFVSREPLEAEEVLRRAGFTHVESRSMKNGDWNGYAVMASKS